MAPTRKAGGPGKVGKKFASVDCMLNLIDAVNETEDARVGKKLERMEKIKQLNAERRAKMKLKKAEKRKRIDEIKAELKRKPKSKPTPVKETVQERERKVRFADS